jgi:hypothetical protein
MAMKKYISNIFQIGLILICFSLISGCEKKYKDDYKLFLGTWISTDLVDTVEFTTDKDFYKMISGVRDHFNYNLNKDKITIHYNGIQFIMVIPSTHPYELNGDQLTIDFRPSCYGFREQKVYFTRR